MNRKRLMVSAAGMLVAVAIAGGVAYATIPGPGNVYSACMLKGLGTIRLIDKSLPSTNLMSHCTDKETEISWNQAGQPGPAGPQGAKGEPGAPGTNGTNGTDGKDGVSVTTAPEPAGANCAGGGVQLTAVSGVNYVCNGKEGAAGKDGANGANGADGADGVSVTSTVEPAGTNCANGGAKFTAASGVTYACNGTDGSGSSSPVVFDRAGGVTLTPGDSRFLVAGSEVSVAVTCFNGLLFMGVNSPAYGKATDAALWEGFFPRYLPTPSTNGGDGTLANSATDQPFPLSSCNRQEFRLRLTEGRAPERAAAQSSITSRYRRDDPPAQAVMRGTRRRLRRLVPEQRLPKGRRRGDVVSRPLGIGRSNASTDAQPTASTNRRQVE